MTTAPAPRAARAPHFSAKQRRELQESDGLTAAQLENLDRALVNVAFELQRSAAMNDVRDMLVTLDRCLAPAAKVVSRMVAARRPSPAAEAMGHLNLAAAQVGWGDREDALADAGYPIGTELIQLAADVAAHARRIAPRTRRTPTVASWHAIEFIVEALNRPDDPASRAAAAQLRLTRAIRKPGRPSFLHVAEAAFRAASGRSSASPDRSIRAYLTRARQVR